MPLCRIYSLAGLILCLIEFIPATSLAAPNLARATATVSARILVPVSVAVNYSTATGQARLRVSGPHQQVYQLHIGQRRQHSYQQALSKQDYPLAITPSSLKLAKSDLQQPPATLYFN